VLVDGWQPHAYVHDPARPRTLILALYIEPAWLSLFRPSWAASGSSGFFGSPSGAVSAAIRSLSMDLASELMHRPEQHAEHEQLLSKLMIAVIERFSPWQETTTSLRSIKTAVPDRRIRRVAAIMRNDPADGSDMEAVARQAGLSRAHFFRLFQSTIGVPPRVYVNVMRVERAVAAVMNHGSNISDIATQLGFSEAAHFTRFFRNHTGVSPSEFRQVSQMTD
jgi:AraC-like DNA-binding protein